MPDKSSWGWQYIILTTSCLSRWAIASWSTSDRSRSLCSEPPRVPAMQKTNTNVLTHTQCVFLKMNLTAQMSLTIFAWAWVIADQAKLCLYIYIKIFIAGSIIMYSWKIWWGFKFGGLAVGVETAELKSTNIIPATPAPATRNDVIHAVAFLAPPGTPLRKLYI